MTERHQQQRVLQQFLREASTNLKNIEGALDQLRQDPAQAEPIKELFRAFHGIKGTSGYAQASEIGLLSHEAETILKQVQEGNRLVDQPVVDAMLELHDQLYALLDALEKSEPPPMEWQDLLERLRLLRGADVAEEAAAAAESPEQRFFDVVSQQATGLEIFFEKLAPGPADPPLTKAILRKLKLMRRSSSNAGYADFGKSVEAVSAWLEELRVWRHDDIASFKAQLKGLDEQIAVLRGVQLTSCRNNEVAEPRSEAERDISIPVRSSRLRRLSTQVEDLVVTHNRLKHILDDLGQRQPEIGSKLRGVRSEMERVVAQLERTAQRAQMIELSVLFDRVPRIVRKIAKEEGKEISLDIHGADTEIDRSIVDLLGDPLTHVVRNAIDHGIETPTQRLAQGKPAAGTLNMHAYAMGKHVFIDIQDDGRGIDSQLIREKAVQKGYLTSEAARRMSEREVMDVLYAPGFSSADSVSQVSGRGVGMDAVLQRISEMGGQIRIKTEVGVGTTIRFVLPNSFTLVSCLVVRCGEHLFALPIRFAKETLRVQPRQIVKKGEERWLRKKGRLARVRHLEDAVPGLEKQEQGERLHGFVMAVGGREIVFDVDELVSMSTLSVRSLPAHLESHHALAGVTTVGAGKVAFFLHALAIVERFAGRTHTTAKEEL